MRLFFCGDAVIDMECDCVFVGEGQGKEGEEGEEDRGCGSSRRSSGRRGGASGGKVGRTEEENRKRLCAFQPGSNHRIQRGKRLLCHSNSSKTYSDLHADFGLTAPTNGCT